MKIFPLSLSSLCVACAFVAVLFLAMSQKPAAATATFEYKIGVDLDDGDIKKLASEGWEYVGYLGTSPRGASTDETHWKRPAK
ncbi:MAG: hypothetical protein JNL28_10615 [Planctomycetes bacterium]|nr:hypothetical protein [Planctomycetota bacterium]